MQYVTLSFFKHRSLNPSPTVPPLLAKAADLHNSTAIGMIVPTCVFFGGWTYAFAVNFIPSYRNQVDKVIGHSDRFKPVEGLGVDEVESNANQFLEKGGRA